MASLPLSPGTTLPDGTDTLTVDQVAGHLGVSANRVRTLIRDHNLFAVSASGQPAIPALFFDDDGIAKHYTGLVDVLLDGGFTRDEALRWMFTTLDDLGIHPAEAIHTHSAREVIRRAQALAL
ncbi:DNA-binding protein [Gordonia pseudamarae]|uniref:DNA-binding protein n=1 Tax=Gordonia pseudamarae TaxID=2831662 RepID=A0ABX6IK36_9ACTN|nr:MULTISPECIES: Rv2175c family DNA-binding protein [Gordonia]MBD0022629.1 DNA-binding protein [Gordonia sp. (in: high G+C Gram-positive bacteria)]QHN26815.1 DNA-binding protein [Gordonia pseudamarae]QHN35706.1 DNA-binding protein [Gordonia pseudamarae]